MYADDIVIKAETPNMMRMMFGDICEYLEENDLKLNQEKTKYIFNKTKGRMKNEEKINKDKKEVKRVANTKYLGVTVIQDLGYEAHVVEIAKKQRGPCVPHGETFSEIKS